MLQKSSIYIVFQKMDNPFRPSEQIYIFTISRHVETGSRWNEGPKARAKCRKKEERIPSSKRGQCIHRNRRTRQL